MTKVDNAIIMAAGTSSRFAPLSYEKHKAMTEVHGEVLIERQIRQLKEAGIPQIVIVTGYKAEQFDYLKGKYGVILVHNPDYLVRNNNSSIMAARSYIGNSYICSSDNYFEKNPFEAYVEAPYYAAQYVDKETSEWCMEEDEDGNINKVTVGGRNAWYMLGHVFWDSDFSSKFLQILEKEYDLPETADKLWETIFMEHLDVLKMKIRKYSPDIIYEFDTIDELREFDPSYIADTRSAILKKAADRLSVSEADIVNITSFKSDSTAAAGFEFDCPKGHFKYLYSDI